MQMVIHNRVAADRYREDFRKFLQAPIDPFLAVEASLSEQEGAADAARNAVIPTGQRNIDEVSAGDGHGAVSWCDRPRVSNRWRRCQDTMPVLSLATCPPPANHAPEILRACVRQVLGIRVLDANQSCAGLSTPRYHDAFALSAGQDRVQLSCSSFFGTFLMQCPPFAAGAVFAAPSARAHVHSVCRPVANA